jgi:hypothetical protein
MKPKIILAIAVIWASLMVSGAEQTQWECTTNAGAITVRKHHGNCGEAIVPTSVDGQPVTSIEAYTFLNGTQTSSVLLPDSITNIAEWAFYGCCGLTAITARASNPSFSSVDGVLFNKWQTALVQYPQYKTGDYKIPRTVTSIGGVRRASCCGR